MKLWILRNVTVREYDTYNSCIVAAKTEDDAREIHPSTFCSFEPKDSWRNRSWCKQPEDVIVEYLGKTDRKISGIVLASFDAG